MIVTVKSAVQKVCPYKNERDDGTATLTFEVLAGDAAEFHNLAGMLALGSDEAISHEGFTRALFTTWEPKGCIRVETTWHTAGLEVRCAVPGEPHQLAGGA